MDHRGKTVNNLLLMCEKIVYRVVRYFLSRRMKLYSVYDKVNNFRCFIRRELFVFFWRHNQVSGLTTFEIISTEAFNFGFKHF